MAAPSNVSFLYCLSVGLREALGERGGDRVRLVRVLCKCSRVGSYEISSSETRICGNGGLGVRTTKDEDEEEEEVEEEEEEKKKKKKKNKKVDRKKLKCH
jgi:hypothetical protein